MPGLDDYWVRLLRLERRFGESGARRLQDGDYATPTTTPAVRVQVPDDPPRCDTIVRSDGDEKPTYDDDNL